MDDLIIIGGSFAGLAGALQLVRARRKVTVLDTGLPRNRFAAHSHGVLGHDHKPPAEILASARQQLTRYPTFNLVNARAQSITGERDNFAVLTDDGQTLSARRILLAYGVTDTMPAIPGFAECWGKSIVSCPYCDGFEVADRHWGLLYGGAHTMHAVQLFGEWTSRITVFANGHTISPEDRAEIARRGFAIVDGDVASISHTNGQIAAIHLADGGETAVDVLFAHPKFRPSSDLHIPLGILEEPNPLGATLKLDEGRQTTFPGIFAAGDLVSPMASVTLATASGAMAAIFAQRSLIMG